MTNLIQDSKNLKAFTKVMSFYEELIEIDGTNSCTSFYSRVHPLVSFPIICEFLTDVETLAKSTLDNKEYLHFLYTYKFTYEERLQAFENKLTFTIIFNEKLIQLKMGQAFLKHKLYPFDKYLKRR